jgi:hydroxymethylpyrimidine/phosphomethylpyrimidine kinase
MSILIVSGFDPSGGAGFISDVRLAQTLGQRAVGAISALTVQDTRGVRQVQPVPAEVLREQLVTLLSDVEVGAAKLGMLGDEAAAEAIADALALTRAPVVWDPVISPSQGSAPLYLGDPGKAAQLLSPHVAVATPNVREAEALCGHRMQIADAEGMERAAREIAQQYGFAVLVTGGHLDGDEVVDVLATGNELLRFAAPRLPGASDVHGTGCALSTAIACELAGGADLSSACERAASALRDRLREPVRAGRGASSVM